MACLGALIHAASRGAGIIDKEPDDGEPNDMDDPADEASDD